MTTELGAAYLGDGRTEFLVWAPNPHRVELHLVTPEDRLVPMDRLDRGYHHAMVDGVEPGARYRYRLDNREFPDPASRSQPEGVHGASEVVDLRSFAWTDGRRPPVELSELVVYELHVGAFTPEGTFDAIVHHLDGLAALGLTAIELMPIAQFSGARNWGYDGVFSYAVHDSYGGPTGFHRLVDECHRRGLTVVLDVVYNHAGPEGNVLAEFGPYFTDRYRTPWGEAMNFDGPSSDEVRRYCIDNALFWSNTYHVDALRLDAIHGIVDTSAHPFLQELSEAADANDRPLLLIAETDQNDVRIVTPRERGGLGIHAQWSDDFHHALHTVLTGEHDGYYADFGTLDDLAKAYREGFVYSGQFSRFRGRQFGSSSLDIPGERLVICAQNHDQVGNRAGGERLSALVSAEELKLVAGALLLSPYVPLLFMGEEYGELAPFQYFISHSDLELVENVRRGRREEFAAFGWGEAVSDPYDMATFENAKLDHGLKDKEPHRSLVALYRELLGLRRTHPALRTLSKEDMEVQADEERRLMTVHRWAGPSHALALFNFSDQESDTALPAGDWTLALNSADERWGGKDGAARGGATPERAATEIGRTRIGLAERSDEGSRAVPLRKHSFMVLVKEEKV